ncbi:HepT-like ribonuclease domain-containing protein [Flavobacterium sp.]|uniref:HepT-like ribonuclease domain-containing protein n=1 Tax=Flavobacterium sp. TaxID=239 RepID=UPI003340642C
MQHNSNKYLYDILNAIELIDQFLQNCIDFTDYVNDLKTKSAVERQLAIVGEAANKYDKNKLEKQPTLIFSKEIINFRNRLVHAYDSIDDSIVWAIKTNHLPQLKKEITNIIH